MRALTVFQPWGSLVMTRTPEGGCLKPVENRKRPVPSTLPQWHLCPCGHRISPDEEHPYGDPRGHAVVRPDPWTGEPMRDACGPGEPDGPFPFRLGIHAAKKDPDSHPWPRIAYESIPHGDGLPTGVLLGTVLVTGCHWADDCVPRGGLAVDPSSALCSRWAERDCYHITLTDPQPLPEPVPMRGYQGWWTLPDDVPALVEAVAR